MSDDFEGDAVPDAIADKGGEGMLRGGDGERESTDNGDEGSEERADSGNELSLASMTNEVARN